MDPGVVRMMNSASAVGGNATEVVTADQTKRTDKATQDAKSPAIRTSRDVTGQKQPCLPASFLPFLEVGPFAPYRCVGPVARIDDRVVRQREEFAFDRTHELHERLLIPPRVTGA